jgi:LysM repeat protein
MRFSFLVSVLLAGALAATVLAAALLVGLFPGSSGGTATASGRPTFGTFVPSTPAAITPTPLASVAEPSPTAAESFDPGQGGTYTVRSGDSLSLIGERLGIPWQTIAEANGIVGPAYIITPGMILIIPAITVPTSGADFYVVQSGDTITGIAQQFDIDPSTLADFNNIADWNSIAVGDKIYIPADADATPRPLESF